MNEMTVKQLKEILNGYKDNDKIILDVTATEYGHATLEILGEQTTRVIFEWEN